MNWLFRVVAVVAVALRLRRTDIEERLTPEEEAGLRGTLGDALKSDGTIDFDRLESKWGVVDPQEWQGEPPRARNEVAAHHQP